MANTLQGRFSYTVIDELGTESSVPFYVLLDPALTVGDMLVDANTTTAQALDKLTDGQITQVRAAVLSNPIGVKNAPIAASRVEQTGLFNFFNTSNTRRFGEALAAFKSSLIVNGKINLSATDVVNFITLLTTAFADGEYATNEYIPLAGGSLADALLSFRKRRRQLSRSSAER
jgi:hypothetical protein